MICCFFEISALSSMALLGMSANRLNNGYIQGYHSPRNLVFSAEGSTWTSSNYTGEREDDCYGLGSSPLTSTCHLLGYNKELLKQTILKHEAIFRDQIHELHRIYKKQRELMDEIKRIELYKHTIRLETSSSSSLYYSQNLHWFTSQSSILNAEGIQLSLASMQEKSRQLCPPLPAPALAAIIESPKDPTLSVSAYRKVGKKILDLQLLADEYIDSDGESCENERAIKELALSTYTLNGISKGVYNTVEKPFRTNFNGFSNLNLPFKLEEETGVLSDDFGASIHHKNYTFHDMPKGIRPGSHSFPNDVIHNLERKQDLQLPNQGTKHVRLPLGTGSGQNGTDLDSLAIFSDTESQSVSIESISKKLKQVNNCSCFHSTNQIVPGLRTDRDSFAGTHNPTSGVWLGPSYASCPCSSHQLVSESDLKSSRISPSVLWKSIASGSNVDCQNCLHSKFCNRSNLFCPPSVDADEPNSCDNGGPSSAGHEIQKYVKESEYVETHKNINLNVMPVGSSETKATEFQSIQITGEYDKFQDSRLPWLKEKPVPKGNPTDECQASTPIDSSLMNPSKSGCIHSDLELNKVQKSDLCRDKTLAFDLNGKPQTTKVIQSLSTDHRIEEINKISNVNLPSDGYPDMGKQASVREYMKNEKKNKHSSGILDLNSCTDEDENMAVDIDLQAPPSPENKECSPPRGESDENQLEMLQLAGKEQEVPEAREEQTRIAAEALISISEALTYDGIQMKNCPSSDPSISSSLHWFSGIVSTVVDHPEYKGKEDFTCTIKDLEDFLPSDFDYFEFMSLNLADTKDLDYCHYKSSGQNEKEGLSTSPSQPKKCRTNRKRRGNDFQSDILPSLASLSRYEVTEDLQTIGGLVEASRRTPSASGCLRSASRNVVARGKRRSCGSSSNIKDLLLNLKELNIDTEIAIEKMGYISFGKICRKPRGKRFPTSKSHLIFSQVHN